MGRGSKRRQFPREWGQILKVFFPETLNETSIIVFIDDLTLTVIAQNALFTAYLYDIVYMFMNVVGS